MAMSRFIIFFRLIVCYGMVVWWLFTTLGCDGLLVFFKSKPQSQAKAKRWKAKRGTVDEREKKSKLCVENRRSRRRRKQGWAGGFFFQVRWLKLGVYKCLADWQRSTPLTGEAVGSWNLGTK